MSRWVKQQYEGALAFLFIVIAAIMPWSISISDLDELGSMYSVQWWIGEYVYLTAIPELTGWRWVHDAISMQSGQAVFIGYATWGIGTALFTGLLLLGIALGIREEAVINVIPIPLRNVAGTLFVLAGSAYVAASALIWMNGPGDVFVPLGALFYLLFGFLLLTNQYRVTESLDDPPENKPEPVTPDPVEEPATTDSK